MGHDHYLESVQEHIKKPLAEELLFGRLSGGGVVKIRVKKNELVFDYEPADAATKKNSFDIAGTKSNINNKKVKAR
jgi:hypothetical protein